MSNLREAAEQALEALERTVPTGEITLARWQASITALRAALAEPEQEPDMRHPKIQALIGSRARKNIEMMLVEQLLEKGPDTELTAMDMEYWNSTHDKLREALLRTAEVAPDEPERRCGGPGCDGNCCQPVAAAVAEPVAWDWLRGVMDGIPTREERIGGQREKYVAKEAVMGWLHEGQSRAKRAAPSQREPDVPETRFGDMPERLRTYSADAELSDRYSDAMQEAADEIEQLREQNTMLDATLAQLEAAAVAEPVLTVDALRVEFERSYKGKAGIGLARLTGGEYLSPAIETAWVQFFSKYTSPPQREPLTDEQIEDLAHREAWTYRHSSDPHHSHTYKFNRACLLEFARKLLAASAPKEQE